MSASGQKTCALGSDRLLLSAADIRTHIRCYGISRPLADLRSSSRSDLENERGQLIERVGKLQADENQGYDHQIRAKMHEGVKTKVSS
jgi:hypothetical protein